MYIRYIIVYYDQKGRVELQRLNFKCEINVYGVTLRSNAAKQNKQDKTKLNKPNKQQLSIQINNSNTINLLQVFKYKTQS